MPEYLNRPLIENVLSTVFDFYQKRVLNTPSDRANFDFVITDENGKKIAIEVKSQQIPQSSIIRLGESLKNQNEINEFIMITPEDPDESQLHIFDKFISRNFLNAKWLSLEQFLKDYFGIIIKDKEDLAQLQLAAITSKINLYSKDKIGNKLSNEKSFKVLNDNINAAKKGETKLAKNLISLRRQFPDALIAYLSEDEENLFSNLHIGEKYNDAIIVLTDLKNFSTIVTAAEPEDLNNAMSKYYSNARDLVFKYNGILDKFIGDAVLAIFNYPNKDNNSFLNALKFSAELILLGKETFGMLLSKMDHSIEFSTRIGISNGPIYTLNIGKGEVEVTFIGDKINFAARLEKNCEQDGILISNRFFNKIHSEFVDFTPTIKIKQRSISPSDAKGQLLEITAWQIEASELDKLIEFKIT